MKALLGLAFLVAVAGCGGDDAPGTREDAGRSRRDAGTRPDAGWMTMMCGDIPCPTGSECCFDCDGRAYCSGGGTACPDIFCPPPEECGMEVCAEGAFCCYDCTGLPFGCYEGGCPPIACPKPMDCADGACAPGQVCCPDCDPTPTCYDGTECPLFDCPPPIDCHPEGEGCADGLGCCEGLSCTAGFCRRRMCPGPGEACLMGRCCSGLVCGPDGTCDFPAGRDAGPPDPTCGGPRAACDDPSSPPCCEGLVCNLGRCGPPCDMDSDCVSPDGTALACCAGTGHCYNPACLSCCMPGVTPGG